MIREFIATQLIELSISIYQVAEFICSDPDAWDRVLNGFTEKYGEFDFAGRGEAETVETVDLSGEGESVTFPSLQQLLARPPWMTDEEWAATRGVNAKVGG